MKLISFVVPCYNSQSYMSKCIDSLLTGGDDVEIIVVNDGSVDDTIKIARDYEKKYPSIIKVVDKENATGWVRVYFYIRLIVSVKACVKLFSEHNLNNGVAGANYSVAERFEAIGCFVSYLAYNVGNLCSRGKSIKHGAACAVGVFLNAVHCYSNRIDWRGTI